jgi:hypothetical protein
MSFFEKKNQKRYQKTKNSMPISNSLKKFLKDAPKKIINKTSLMNMSKSGKGAYFFRI